MKSPEHNEAEVAVVRLKAERDALRAEVTRLKDMLERRAEWAAIDSENANLRDRIEKLEAVREAAHWHWVDDARGENLGDALAALEETT